MIDIIIPAYNAHDVIEKNLLSICMQTIKDKIKVYIIDDCSDNDYSEIIKLFQDKIIIKELKLKENSGPGIARQYGIDNSNGEYIYFLDADDMFIDCYSLENLVNNIGDNDIICGRVFYEDYDNCIFVISNQFDYQLHGKLYRRDYIKKYNFKFNNSRNGEDNCFNRLLKLGTDKYIHIESDTSIYSYNPKSITNSDIDYIYNEVPKLSKNMIWMANEAEKRNFDKTKITIELFYELMHFTNLYVENYEKKGDQNILLEAFNTIYKKINGYNVENLNVIINEIMSEYQENNFCLSMFEIIYKDIVSKSEKM